MAKSGMTRSNTLPGLSEGLDYDKELAKEQPKGKKKPTGRDALKAQASKGAIDLPMEFKRLEEMKEIEK